MSMEKSFWTAMCAVAFASLSASAANVWHVNNKAPNASDTNPGTEAEPFLTINDATTNALSKADCPSLLFLNKDKYWK